MKNTKKELSSGVINFVYYKRQKDWKDTFVRSQRKPLSLTYPNGACSDNSCGDFVRQLAFIDEQTTLLEK